MNAVENRLLIRVGILIGIVSLLIGFGLALLISKSINFNNELTADGLISALIALITLAIAAIVIPLILQPILQRQKSINNLSRRNIDVIINNIESLQDHLRKLYFSKIKVTDQDRKHLYDKYTTIVNYAFIVKRHSANLPSLSNFEDKVYLKLSSAKEGCAVDVLPQKAITEDKYIAMKDQLNEVLYELIEYSYQLP